MGQYFYPLLVADNGDMYRGYSHDFNEGLKLMEHSWVGNDFVNAILGMIDGNPMRMAWIGDYSDGVVSDDTNFGDGFVVGRDSFMRYFFYATGHNDGPKKLENDVPRFLFDMNHTDCYAVNLTKQVYIDLEKYVSKNEETTSDGFGVYCINPIPLLTSIGNGQGMGDYKGEEGMADIGTWAFDKIYISALRPGTIREVEFHFSENHW